MASIVAFAFLGLITLVLVILTVREDMLKR